MSDPAPADIPFQGAQSQYRLVENLRIIALPIFRPPGPGSAVKPPVAPGFLRASFEPSDPSCLNACWSLASLSLTLAPSFPERWMLTSWWVQWVAAVAVVTTLVVLVLAGRAVSRANAARDAAERRSRAQAEELAKALNMRAEADAALGVSQAQFQSIMRHAPMMVALKDLQGRYTFVNEAFREYTGRDADIVIGKTAADFNPRELADFIAREDRDAVESRRVIQREITPPARRMTSAPPCW